MRYLIVFCLMATLSCAQRSQTTSGEKVELSFGLDSLVKEVCAGDNCASMRLVWPVASGADAADQINLAVSEQVAFLVQTGETVAPLDSLVKDYFASFESFKADFPDAPGGWEINAEGEVSYRSDSTLSLFFTQSSYLGGAHPNSFVSFLHFDPATGEVLGEDRLILDERALASLAEKKFREVHEVVEGVSLEEDGRFFLPETGFFLANAKGFKEGKFWLIYVPYEIGSYAMGYTELEFTREELGDIVRW